MTPVFQIRHGKGAPDEGTRPDWSKLGLTKNPFPDSGVLGTTLYAGHMPDVVGKIQAWLDDVASRVGGESRGPFALEGTIGAGKTHLLAAMETAFLEHGSFVVRENLVNAGGGRLLLSTLFGTNLPLDEIADAVLAHPELPAAVEALPSASPLRAVFTPTITARNLVLWLRGSSLTKTQLQTVGGRTLDGEGERLRAVIHLLRLASSLNHLQLVVFLLDQLEDLERRSEITPLRRARFLTDLRIFIDEGLEGAPIALCMAWNTEGTAFMNALESQYPALASRLANRAMVPGLSQPHLIPFAEAYLDAAYEKGAARALRVDPRVAASLAGSLRPLPGGDVAPREWLDQLRKWAEREALRA